MDAQCDVWMLILGTVVFGILLAAWRRVGVGVMSKRLRAAGFARSGRAYTTVRHGMTLRAHLRQDRRHGLLLHIEGPRLPEGAPWITQVDPYARTSEDRVWSGDLELDRTARIRHDDQAAGLSWLHANARHAIRRAVAAHAVLEEGRWRCQVAAMPMVDIDGIVEAICAATTAMLERPAGALESLEAMALSDPVFSVRRKAIAHLGAGSGLRPALLERLFAQADPAVLLSVIEHGGDAARTAWRRLREVGTGASVLQGALAMALHDLEPSTEAELQPLLVKALAFDAHAEAAVKVLSRMEPSTVLEQVRVRYGDAPPPAARSLTRALRSQQRRRSAGALSVADDAGGELSLAATDR